MTSERANLVAELLALRQRLDEAILRLQGEETAAPAAPAPPPAVVTTEASLPAATAPPQPTAAGLLTAIDLSDDLRDVYLVLLRHDALTLGEMSALPELRATTDLPVLVRTLARQGHLEKYQDAGAVRYRARAGVRTPRHVPDAIWQALQ